MKVLLISANRLRSPYPVYPIALDYLAGILKPKHSVRLLDMIDMEPECVIKNAIHEFCPDCIGISIRNIDNSDAANAASFISEYKIIVNIIRNHTSSPIILGGAGYTLFPKRLIDELGADYGIAGEGERFLEFVNAVENGADPSGLPGVIVSWDQPQAPMPWEGEIIRDIVPDASLSSFYLNSGGMMNLQTKRGCPYRCIYCTYPVIEGGYVRFFAPGDVGMVAAKLKDAGAKYIYITDSVFNSDEGHCLEIAEELSQQGADIPWGGFFSPVRPSTDFYKRLASAGLTHVEFGTESLCEGMLKTYRKPFNVEDVFAAYEDAREAGLHIAHYFMLGGPGETHETVIQTLENAERLQSSVLFFFCGVRIYPGTELFNRAKEEGKLLDGDDLLTPRFYQSEGISSKDIIGMIDERARGRKNWVMGSGGEEMNRIVSRLYARGRTGPLWEKLI
jgi:radical SAM superfamily enzyme YgiQ (UPF0313 family)